MPGFETFAAVVALMQVGLLAGIWYRLGGLHERVRAAEREIILLRKTVNA